MIISTNIKNGFHQISSFIITDTFLKYVDIVIFPFTNAPELKRT